MTTKAETAPSSATPEDVAAFRSEQEKEWGTYICGESPISFNGVLAYLPGTPVPVANVKRHKYDELGLVEKVGSKKAQELARRLHAATTDTAVAEQPAPVSLGVTVTE